MATVLNGISGYIRKASRGGMWARAMRDIFYFVEHYVPKRLFDLERASSQQIALLKAVQEGKIRYFIIRAPRKGGKTILVAIVTTWLTLRDQTYRVFILSGSEAQAKWLYDYCRDILWPSGPEYEARRKLFGSFLKREPMTEITEYKEGGFIMYSAASSKKVNAPTADCLVNDEFVLIPSDIIEEAWPMIRGSENPLRFILSTATAGKENIDAFLDMLEEAEPGGTLYKLGFRKFEWEEKDCPFLQTEVALADSEVARIILSDDMYVTQYIGQLPRKAGRIFPRTFVREAFVAPDRENPGYLMDGTPYDPDNLVFRGHAKAGVDWGFDHDTVFTEGYRGLNGKIVIMKLVAGSGASPSDWAQQAEDDAKEHDIWEWFADAAGAFQNRELEDRGLKIKKRPFQHQSRGKEWMIGILYYWLQKRWLVIPDTEEFAPLKKQLLKYKRGKEGKPIKKNDHYVDSLLCFISGWDPRYVVSTAYEQPAPEPERSGGNDWSKFNSSKDGWMPDGWRERKEELTRNPWEK